MPSHMVGPHLVVSRSSFQKSYLAGHNIYMYGVIWLGVGRRRIGNEGTGLGGGGGGGGREGGRGGGEREVGREKEREGGREKFTMAVH